MIEKRKFQRYKVDLPIRFLCKETQREGEGRLLDISANGAGLILTLEKLSSGLHLEVWVELADKKEPLYLTGVVVWTKEIKVGVFHAGIQFDKVDFISMWRLFEVIKPK